MVLSRRAASTRVVLAAFLTVTAAVGAVATATVAQADTAGNPATNLATTSTQANVAPSGPLTGLANLSNVHIAVTAPAGTNQGFEIRLCKGGVNITGNSQFVPLQGGNCILNPITAGSDSFQTIDADPTLTTATTDFKVGSGTTTWNTPNGSKSVTCDSANPCALWLKESIGAGIFFVHYDLSFGSGGGLTVPGKPLSVTARAGNVSADVSWAAPASDGGSAITGYTVTTSPGGATCSWTAGPRTCDVHGLTSGTAYTFTVKATNAQGAGPASDPSPAVTPTLFADVPTTAQFFADIDWMVAHGITTGFADGFHPVAPVERQAMAAFLYRAKGSPNGLHPTCASAPFPDVAATAQFCGEIAWMSTQGITTGFPDGGFHPSAPVERQAMAAFLYRFHLGTSGAAPTCATAPFADVPTSAKFCGEIKWMKDNAITNGFSDGYHPAADIERQAMAAFLHRLILLPS